MLERLWAFAPAITVFIGAVIVAGGTFWAAWRQSHFNSEIRTKNEAIIRAQREGIDAITGGDSFAYLQFQVVARDGTAVNAHSMPIDLLLCPIVIHKGKYPLYDLAFRMYPTGVPFEEGLKSEVTAGVGNISANLATTTTIRIPHHGRDITYNIFFSARNGLWTQILRMRWMGDGWATANKVLMNGKDVFREVSANFPKTPDGRVDWQEKSAVDTDPQN